jgi:pimeloyl-ACP methyl ester carboxylesterase
MREYPLPISSANADKRTAPVGSFPRGCLLLLVVVVLSGCRSAEKSTPWSAPPLASPALSPVTKNLTARWADPDSRAPTSGQLIQQARLTFPKHLHRDNAFALAELHYAAGFREEAAGSEACVDLFYQAAGFAYYALFGPSGASLGASADQRMRDLYNSSLARLIEDGQLYGRLDPKKQLTVRTSEGMRDIPLIAHTGPWAAHDIDQLVVVGDYRPEDFSHRFGQTGLGVALVAVRHRRGDGSARDGFLLDKHPFAVTAVLHPDLEALMGRQSVVPAFFTEPAGSPHHALSPSGGEGMVRGPKLELYDPGQVSVISLSGRQETLAADLSAPLQYSVDSTRLLRLDILGFRQPGHAAKMSGLFLMEPYQRGKIPVVFIHGLLSDPHTWDEMLNELRADPDINAHFQFAVYLYPTGNPFLISAENLRKKLQDLQRLDDPANPDAALRDMILIGHSMGGVLSRFQVTSSEDLVWALVARRPFAELNAPPATRMLLHDAFFFEPQPFVKRVVFIGTPHRGSTLARTIVGRIGATLVTPPPEITQTRDLLLAENPDAFNPAFAKHLPTSVEDLAAGSPILDVMQKLPFSPQVHLHSIIGRGKFFPLLQVGDGYVPVTSAHLDGVESELYVDAEHTMVHRDPNSVSEVKRILRKHWQELAR